MVGSLRWYHMLGVVCLGLACAVFINHFLLSAEVSAEERRFFLVLGLLEGCITSGVFVVLIYIQGLLDRLCRR